jgi:hypothetical protein
MITAILITVIVICLAAGWDKLLGLILSPFIVIALGAAIWAAIYALSSIPEDVWQGFWMVAFPVGCGYLLYRFALIVRRGVRWGSR